MRVLMALIIIFNFIPNVVTADTFYMINKDKFNARILARIIHKPSFSC